MHYRRVWLLAGAALLCAVCAGWGQQTLDERRVTIDVRDAPLSEVAALISKEAEVDIIIHKDVSDEKITLTLMNRPVSVALEAICRAHDLKLDRLDGGDMYFICKPDAKANGDTHVAPPVGPGSSSSGPVNLAPPVRIPGAATPRGDGRLDSARREGVAIRQPTGSPHTAITAIAPGRERKPRLPTQLIPMKYILPSQFASWYGQPSLDYAVDGTPQLFNTPVNLPSATVELGDTINRHDGYLNLARQQKGLQPLNATTSGRAIGRDQFGAQPGGAGGAGGPGGAGGGLGGRQGGGGGLGGAGGGGQQQQAVFELPEGIDELVGYDLISALVVRGEPDAIEQLRELVELLDQPPQQIEVEARFVTLSVSDADALGISWTMTDGTTTVTGSTPSQGGASVAFRTATGNFQALISSIVRNNRGKVVNAPKVATQNGQPAQVAFIQTIPVTQSQTVITDASQTVATTIDLLPVQTSLLVVPRVTGQAPNESITTLLQPLVSDVTGFVDNPGGGTIPIIAAQQIQTTLRVRNGETIALGGLVRKNNSNNSTKIPLLGDLPFIGKLFRSNTHNVDESELLIFITPTIIRELFLGGGPRPIG
ncbi:MAG: type II secretion system protein GspD [Armatimonadetes bacterium]|nr:type II secretion system protein GspD [Armatimonadota bacterium]